MLIDSGVIESPVMIHEMGHCLGLGHSPRSGDLMAPNQSRNSRFTSDERVLVTMMYERRRPGNAPPDDDQALAPLAHGGGTLTIWD